MVSTVFGASLMGGHLAIRELTGIPENANITIRDFVATMIPLLVIAAFVQMLSIEGDLQLPLLLWICVGGFALYAWLPLPLRLPFFLFLNGLTLLLLFEPVTALATLGFGALLFLIASARVSLRFKLPLLLSLGVYLGCVKAGLTGNYYLYQASGILGGLFMFRTALYLYELRFEKAPVSRWKRVSYFFLVPNLAFQLFPIVDYKTFVRGYYKGAASAIYRKGLYFVAIGVLHLFAYRILYSYALLPLEDITTLPALVQHVVASYALIVRLSGIFHLCTGLVCLFGFDLPRSFNNYFLASSFSDIWLRINPYWRAFVMKLFYFPLYFRIKHLGLWGMFFTVVLVFVINFFLHTYQWFWIRGDIQITETDILFWSILGLSLAVNSVWAAKQHRKASTGQTKTHWAALVHAIKVLSTFISMCLLWSLWTSGSLAAVSEVLSQIAPPSGAQCASLFAGLIALLCLGWAVQVFSSRSNWALSTPLLARPLLLILLFAGLYGLMSERGTAALASAGYPELQALRSEGLNRAEHRQLAQGYYEDLMVPNQITSRLWQLEEQRDEFNKKKIDAEKAVRMRRGGRKEKRHAMVTGQTLEEIEIERNAHPDGSTWGNVWEMGVVEEFDDSLKARLRPNLKLMLRGTEVTTNAHGMRDRRYTIEKPPGTYRIAQLGGSPELALGTPDEKTADNLLEDALTKSGQWGGFDNVEILNFAMVHYTLLEQVAVSNELVPQWQPDVVMIYIHDVAVFRRMKVRLATNVAEGKELDFEYLRNLVDELGLEDGDGLREIKRKLNRHSDALFFWGLRKIIEQSEKINARVVFVYMGILANEVEVSERVRAKLLPFFEEEGIPLLNLADIFEGYDHSKLIVAPWDLHPNETAQHIVADRLYREMMAAKHLFLEPPTP